MLLSLSPELRGHGARDEARTRDSLLGRQILYQLSYPCSTIMLPARQKVVKCVFDNYSLIHREKIMAHRKIITNGVGVGVGEITIGTGTPDCCT
jgi:hypothetical protein